MDLAAAAKMTVAQLAVLVALFLPGFVSLKIDRLIHPGDDLRAPELTIEAFGYSVINAGILIWPILLIFQELGEAAPEWRIVWPLGILTCVLGPVMWPVAFRAVQRLGVRYGWMLGSHKFAWDSYFGRREPCWVIVHLPNGELVGGYFGPRSYATMAPQSGHLYLEELWRLDEQGRFLEAIPSTKGALFRSGDYHWIEIIKDEPAQS